MRTGMFITARLGSSRLKRKHLRLVNDKPIISYLLERSLKEFENEIADNSIKVVIVSSDEEENREFERHIPEWVDVFYGSKENIPLRHLQAAQHFGFNNIIAVDGDDILCSCKAMRAVYHSLLENEYVKTDNLPFGMNVMGYSRNFLDSSLQNYENTVLETGWGRIFDQSKCIAIEVPDLSELMKDENNLLRFTLDYREDLNFLEAIIKAFGERIYEASDNEIIETSWNSQLYKINEIISKEYWTNFNKRMLEEQLLDIKNTEL
jgi:spore coat polysaccharide biosynthesis protein SpsF